MRFVTYYATAALLATGLAHGQSASDDEGEIRLEAIQVIGETSTFGATKSEIPLLETPRSLTIITEDDFLDFGALTLSNTLSYTAGVTGDAFGFATRGDFTSIRGLDAPEYQDNLQVLFGLYNNARSDIYTLEQVEVLKGPASVLYGQAAPGGIVSTVSKLAGPDKLDKEVVLTVGDPERIQGSVDLGFDLSGDGRWTARLIGLVRESETQVDFVDDNAIVIAPSITYQNNRSSITALFNYTDRDGDTSAQFLPLAATACGSDDVSISEPNVCAQTSGQEVNPSVYVGDPNFNKYNTEATTFSLFGTHRLNDVLSFEGTARYRDNEAEYDQTWISFLGDGNPRILPDGTAIGRSWNSNPAGSTQFAFDARLRATFNTGIVRHNMLGGLNYQDVETESRRSFLYAQPTTFNIFNPVYDGSEVPAAAVFDAVELASETQTIATDFYITNHMNIGNLIVNAGVRLSSVESEDAANDQEDEEMPITLAAMYQTDFGLNPYVSYSESFRATVGTDVVTNNPLKPRKGEQIEIGVKYQPVGSTSYVTAAYFELEEDNLVDFVAGGRTQPGLSVETEGFEIEALLNWRAFSFNFDFISLDANEIDENGVATIRPSVPENAASLWVTWEPEAGPLARFRFGAGGRYASENESNGVAFLAANGFAPTPNRVVTDGFTVFDSLVGYAFDKVDLTLNVRNITDEEYYATCLSRGDCFPAEGRTVTARAAYRF